ncbi:MAG: signal peptidase I [Deltaproteobacteria bacterium]|nr:signal peptidase I [Deltaproteobacteria bacterium]
MKKKSAWLEYGEAAAIAVLLALFIRTFIVQAFKIPSGSMEPTLLIGDHIFVNKFIYGIKIPFLRKTLIPFKNPSRGDIIVFIFPKDESKDFIKRLIGLPGEKIEIKGRDIFIDGKRFDDPYGDYEDSLEDWSNPGKACSYCTTTVPEGHYFVMGDNRDNSEDSRYWGFVPADSIKGKAFIVYWSWPHWKRFLHLVY